MTVNFVDPAKGVSTSALCTEAEAFDASKIVITYLVRRDHPSLKFRIPKASTAQIAAYAKQRLGGSAELDLRVTFSQAISGPCKTSVEQEP